jgi:hypothetical protein
MKGRRSFRCNEWVLEAGKRPRFDYWAVVETPRFGVGTVTHGVDDGRNYTVVSLVNYAIVRTKKR